MLDSPAFNVLQRSIDASALRQKVIANNIANADTPGFKRSDVRFEEYLDAAMKEPAPLYGYRTNARHIPIEFHNNFGPQIITDESTSMNNNLNNVDIDSEMSLMAKNQLKYNTLISQVNSHIKMMQSAIGAR